MGPIADDHAGERGAAEQQSGTDGGTHFPLQIPVFDDANERVDPDR